MAYAEAAVQVIQALYTRFILRDVIAKALPGSLLLIMATAQLRPALTALIARDPFDVVKRLADVPWYIGVALLAAFYGSSFVAGMLTQNLGMWLRLTVIQPWPKPYLQDRHIWRALFAYHRIDDSWEKTHQFLGRPKQSADVSVIRERLAILKEMAGNFGVTLLIVAAFTTLTAYGGRLDWWIPLASAIVGILLCIENRYHCAEQLRWEELVITQDTQVQTTV